MTYSVLLLLFAAAALVWAVASVSGRPQGTSPVAAAGDFAFRFALIALPFVVIAALTR